MPSTGGSIHREQIICNIAARIATLPAQINHLRPSGRAIRCAHTVTPVLAQSSAGLTGFHSHLSMDGGSKIATGRLGAMAALALEGNDPVA